MGAKWLEANAWSFDTETTGPEPMLARIVTAAINEVGPGGLGRREHWTVNPGVPIPAEATAIHGVTDEMAFGGKTTADAVPEIYAMLRAGWNMGQPVIIMNAPYDLTVLREESKRIGVELPISGPVLDPLVIDRAMDPWRKGKRTLAALAQHYGVRLEGAHSAHGDSICAARVLWVQSKRFTELADFSLAEMQEWQTVKHRNWAIGFQKYLRRNHPDAMVSPHWPIEPAV